MYVSMRPPPTLPRSIELSWSTSRCACRAVLESNTQPVSPVSQAKPALTMLELPATGNVAKVPLYCGGGGAGGAFGWLTLAFGMFVIRPPADQGLFVLRNAPLLPKDWANIDHGSSNSIVGLALLRQFPIYICIPNQYRSTVACYVFV